MRKDGSSNPKTGKCNMTRERERNWKRREEGWGEKEKEKERCTNGVKKARGCCREEWRYSGGQEGGLYRIGSWCLKGKLNKRECLTASAKTTKPLSANRRSAIKRPQRAPDWNPREPSQSNFGHRVILFDAANLIVSWCYCVSSCEYAYTPFRREMWERKTVKRE